FGGPTLSEQRPTEECRRARSVDPETLAAEPLVGAAQALLGRAGVVFEQVDQAGEDIDLEQLLGNAELLDHAPRGRDHPLCGLAPPAQRFEDGLAAERDR